MKEVLPLLLFIQKNVTTKKNEKVSSLSTFSMINRKKGENRNE
jgi:hypothetical protein